MDEIDQDIHRWLIRYIDALLRYLVADGRLLPAELQGYYTAALESLEGTSALMSAQVAEQQASEFERRGLTGQPLRLKAAGFRRTLRRFLSRLGVGAAVRTLEWADVYLDS